VRAPRTGAEIKKWGISAPRPRRSGSGEAVRRPAPVRTRVGGDLAVEPGVAAVQGKVVDVFATGVT
jgi:hypothetical protein